MTELITPDTFLISDHHFGHKNIGDFEPDRIYRAKALGFSNYEEMLIHNHNKTVKPTDTCLFLGDFSFNSPSPWASQLNGNKILVLGNHDTRGNEAYKDFTVVRGIHIDWNGTELKADYEDQNQSMFIKSFGLETIAFSHYPLWFDDEYNRQDGSKILNRMRTQEELADSLGVTTVIHGHLHSKTATTKGINYVNVCCEHLGYTPRRLGKLFK